MITVPENEGKPETKAQRNARHHQEDSNSTPDTRIAAASAVEKLEALEELDKQK